MCSNLVGKFAWAAFVLHFAQGARQLVGAPRPFPDAVHANTRLIVSWSLLPVELRKCEVRGSGESEMSKAGVLGQHSHSSDISKLSACWRGEIP